MTPIARVVLASLFVGHGIAVDLEGTVLDLVDRLGKRSRDTENSRVQRRALSSVQELARAAATPNVSDAFSDMVEKLKTVVEPKIRAGHSSTQADVDSIVTDLESTTTSAVSLKQAADAADVEWFNCVRVEKSKLASVESAEKALQEARSNVNEPCQLQEDRKSFSFTPQAEDLAFDCDISIHDNCDAQMKSYRTQVDHLFAELDSDVAEAGAAYAQSKKDCDMAKAKVVRKQSALNNQTQQWQQQRQTCQQKHATRTAAMCAFGTALQHKCSKVAAYNTLDADISAVDGGPRSNPDRAEEWKVVHITKCWLSRAVSGETTDEAALTACARSADFEGDVGKLDLKEKAFASLTSPESFTCSEQTISFKGDQWKIPAGDKPSSEEYDIEAFTPAISLPEGTAPFSFCT